MRRAGALVAGLLACNGALAQDKATAVISPVPQNVIELRPGAQTVIRLSRPFSSVSIGNPDIVDVLPRSDRVFAITAKKVGSSDVVIFDNSVDIYKFTATVGAPIDGRRVLAHTKKGELHQYYAYECSPVCVRVKDELEGPAATAPIIVESRGSTSSTINVATPPPPSPSPPR